MPAARSDRPPRLTAVRSDRAGLPSDDALLPPVPERPEPAASLHSGGRGAPSVDIAHVLEASVRLFGELGFDGVSMRDISRECGCPTPSIYYHFASKSELYKEAYSHKIEQTMDLINARIEAQPDAARRFETLIEAFHDLFIGDRTLLLLMQRDVIDATASGRGFLSQRQYHYFTSLIGRVASECTGRAMSRETAFTIGALIFGYCELAMVIHEVYDQRGEQVLRTERERLVKAATVLLSI